jgi:hypothetical protein
MNTQRKNLNEDINEIFIYFKYLFILNIYLF